MLALMDSPAPGGGPATPGTDAEAVAYAIREAASPETQEFVGGDGGWIFAIFLVGAFVLLYLYLKKQDQI